VPFSPFLHTNFSHSQTAVLLPLESKLGYAGEKKKNKQIFGVHLPDRYFSREISPHVPVRI